VTAHVRDAYRSSTGVWRVVVARDQDLDPRRDEPPLEDVPEDVRQALAVWVGKGRGHA
jgi:hypothetical protein